MKAKSISLLFLMMLNVINCSSQLNPVFSDNELKGYYGISSGYSSIGAYCVGMKYTITKKHNCFSAILQYNSQVGNIKMGFLTPVFYNDKFYEFALVYGRSYQNGILLLEADLGPSGFVNIQKSIAYSSGYISSYYPIKKSYSGIGLFTQGSINLMVSKRFLIGIKTNLNLNDVHINGTVQIQFVFKMFD
jgi:hypothetical protein